MVNRRDFMTLLTLAGTGVLTVPSLTGCSGPTNGPSGTTVNADLVRSDLPRDPADAADAQPAYTAVSAFTADVYRTLAARGSGNLVCSPFSVAMALGMTVQGARGTTATELLSALYAPTGATLEASRAVARRLNALDVALSARAGTVKLFDGSTGEVALSSANSLWGQRDLVWDKGFLDVLALDFGTGMHQVDYRTATEKARTAINGWVSEQTHERIPELLAEGVLAPDTRLTLVNALYLKAPWQTPFEKAATRPAAFTRLDSSTVQAPQMNATVFAAHATGRGWSAARLPYADGRLAMTVVLPEAGRFAEIEKQLDGAWLAGVQTALRPTQVQIGLPRWTTRSQASLRSVLEQLGIRQAFTDDADFSGMTTQERLQVAAVVHEAFVAVDEAGTEAAAATAVVMRVTGAPAEPARLIADRPFLYVIHDNAQGAAPTPLFIGRVLDPTV
ncbi:MAG: serpin family protein [Kineosporiaceae bacterium]|nr:serpin family protein [Kineosporiaceae bacterium]